MLFMAIALSSACKGEADARGGQAPPPAPVILAPVEAKSMPVTVTAIGGVEAFTTVSVLPQVGGEITKVHFEEGTTVKKDELLFTIDTRPYRATLSEAAARVSRDKALAKQAHDQADRTAKLVKEGLATQADLDQANANAQAADATLAADRAAVAGASISVSYATIRSPIAGRTGSLLVHAGNVVAPGSQPLVIIRAMKPIYVRFAVPEKYLSRIRERMSAGTLLVEARPRHDRGTPAEGKLTFVENTVDTATGTIALKAEFPNLDERLWPGQFVDVSLRLSEQESALVVPESAIQAGQNGDHVFVVGSDDKAVLRPVKVDRQVGREIVLESGVKPGERVVVDGQVRLFPGAPVVLKSAQPPSLSAPAEPSAPVAADATAGPEKASPPPAGGGKP